MRWAALLGATALGLVVGRTGVSAQVPSWTLTGNLGAHDPTIIQEGSTWWVLSTGPGIQLKSSPDGLAWTQAGQIFASELPWWRTYAPTMGLNDVWAPDIHYYQGRYWCYYCVSEFGTNNSAIGLTSCSSIAVGDWRDDGLVLSSESGAQSYNALDPDLCFDAAGQPWLVFGSYFDGIHVVPVDPATMKTTGSMSSLAARPNGIEASNIILHGGSYYLFVSIDTCCEGVNSTYKIAVGRSAAITGPYVDETGAAMLAGAATVLDSSGPRWKGPGGQSVDQDSAGTWIIAYHAYDAENNGNPTLQISDLYWGADGWPTFFPPVAASAPVFTSQPLSATVTGGSVALTAVATNAPAYQWMKGGVPVAGATGSTLLLSPAVAGSYTCVASNTAGTATSAAATVAITSTGNPGRLVNISCRATVGTGANILIAGFAVGGSGTEPLLLRASGPALASFGVAGTLPDPELELFSGATVLGTNDGWGGSAAIAATAAAVGAFGWTSGTSHDAALLTALGAGPYTVQVAGQSGDSGVALAEVYDATPAGTSTTGAPRIINLSARVAIGTGGNILIAGFAIGGSTSRTVLVRASGPALAAFGVAGTLPDPQLAVYAGSTLLEAAAAWDGNPAVAAAAAAVGAFPWTSAASADSAVLVTLPPGAYTAQVSGASGDNGVALIEIYEVP